MYVLCTLSMHTLYPTLIQADTIEELQSKLREEYEDWEEFCYLLDEEMNTTWDAVISLWRLSDGKLEKTPFNILQQPVIVF